VRLKEQRLWDAMKRAAPKEFWLQRVENVVGDGMPDVHSCCRVSCAASLTWVELKAVTRPKRIATRFLGNEGLRTSQISWHMKAASMSVRSFVLVRDDHKALYLVQGKFADAMNEWDLPTFESHSIAGNWKEIFGALK
jgi:hypothetical protein